MNKLGNPNALRRAGPAFALAAILLGSTACSGGALPNPKPSETTPTADIPDIPLPSCAVTVRVGGRVATVGVNIEDGDQPGVYAVGSTGYEFGDGAAEVRSDGASISHEYPPGTYRVQADIVMEVAPGASVPFKDGQSFPCTPAVVTIN